MNDRPETTKKTSDHTSRPDGPGSASDAAEPKRSGRSLRGWQKVLLVLSVVLMAIGGSLQVMAWVSGGTETTAATPASPGTGGSGLVSGLTADTGTGSDAGDDGAESEPDPTGIDLYSPMIFRMGFSFFVGFAIAYALRQFVKISIIAIGILLLALFGLQYAGVIDVNWQAMNEHYDSIMAFLGEQTGTFTAFITGYLPSGASGLAGMTIGFKRK
jgi:uncharacterized membrane protein (Fun14 family)